MNTGLGNIALLQLGSYKIVFVTTASWGHREVVGASCFAAGLVAVPYMGIVLVGVGNFDYSFVADYSLGCNHDPFPYFDCLLSLIGSFD